MRKGMKLLCLKNHDTLKSGKVYEISYVDNEKPKIMVCISGKLYPLEILNKKFKLI